MIAGQDSFIMVALYEMITPVILIGGLGTRLRSVIGNNPKGLANVSGKPFVLYLFDQLISAGFDRTTLCTGFKSEIIEETIGEVYKTLCVGYSKEVSSMGTGGALRLACRNIDSEYILLMNGDSYCNVDLRSVIEAAIFNDKPCTMVVTHVDQTDRYGSVQVSSDDHIVSFRGRDDSKGRGWINAGIYCLTRSLAMEIAPDRNQSLEHKYLPMLGRELL